MRRALVVWLSLCVSGVAEQPKPRKPSSDERIRELVRALGASAFGERQAAQEELLRSGEPAREAVKKALAHPDLEVRLRAREIHRRIVAETTRRALERRRAARKLARAPSFDASWVRNLVDRKGTIVASETWKASHSYRLTGPLRIAKGATLTLESGTIVLVGKQQLDRGSTLRPWLEASSREIRVAHEYLNYLETRQARIRLGEEPGP